MELAFAKMDLLVQIVPALFVLWDAELVLATAMELVHVLLESVDWIAHATRVQIAQERMWKNANVMELAFANQASAE